MVTKRVYASQKATGCQARLHIGRLSMRFYASFERELLEGMQKTAPSRQAKTFSSFLCRVGQLLRWRIQYRLFHILIAILCKGHGRSSGISVNS